MPTGIYKRTEKSLNAKGKHWKVKDTTKYKERIVSEITRKKLSDYNKKIGKIPPHFKGWKAIKRKGTKII